MGWVWLLRLVRAIYSCFISVFQNRQVVWNGGWYSAETGELYQRWYLYTPEGGHLSEGGRGWPVWRPTRERAGGVASRSSVEEWRAVAVGTSAQQDEPRSARNF